ncbi:glycosaminoglycan attachment site [Cupriavidus metallidurans]|uniref:glycosaminoglycan attachment site n=1 Tax=Cupriavidus metallidurans TaxID=119219 RepID=UPI001BFCC231|nr:glycosaminoglycan attachment site [Cupriavidus metallidurans]QWC88807.1 glycosaminoglycan attachment site [Cupriavidus metallidurans]
MLDLFTPVLPQSKLCESFKRIAAQATAADRALLAKWLDGFLDRDGKFVQEFQSTFNSGFWELYLHAALTELGMSMDYRFNRPDFVVTSPIDFCIEAVTAQPAGMDRLDPGTLDDIAASMEDINELNRKAMVRLSNAFHSKHRKLKSEYFSLSHVEGKPFVLAIAAFDSPAFFALSTRPIEALLYNYYVDEEAFIAGNRTSLEGEFLEAVAKDNGARIELGVFASDLFSEISAVIYNPTATWGKVRSMSQLEPSESLVINSLRYNPHSEIPHHVVGMKGKVSESLLDGLCIFHNPYAKYPLPYHPFRKESVAQVYLEEGADELHNDKKEGHLMFRNVMTCQTAK